MSLPKNLKLGWIPDTHDARDHVYKARGTAEKLPPAVDHRERFFRAWDQGSLGSCTAQSAAAAAMFLDVYDKDMPSSYRRGFSFTMQRERSKAAGMKTPGPRFGTRSRPF